MGGIFRIVKSVQPLDLGLCREQTDALAHRDPDSGGYFWSIVAPGSISWTRVSLGQHNLMGSIGIFPWAADAGLF